MDVTSLNTNIPHDEGIETCIAICKLKEYRMLRIPSIEFLIKLLGHVLKFNNFMLNGEHYLQINRHAIGTKIHHPMLIYS